MSLVLDALLKAQSQRSRGEVPLVTAGLHSLGGAPASARRASRPPWAWMLLAVLLTALAAWALVSWLGALKPVATQRGAQPSVVPSLPPQSPPQASAPPVLCCLCLCLPRHRPRPTGPLHGRLPLQRPSPDP